VFAYYCGGGCVIVKVFVVGGDCEVDWEKKEKKRKFFNMQNDVVFYFFSMCNPIQTKSHVAPHKACLRGRLKAT